MKDDCHCFAQIACACVRLGGGKHERFSKSWSHRSAVAMATGLSGPQGRKRGGGGGRGERGERWRELRGMGQTSVSCDKRWWKFGPRGTKMGEKRFGFSGTNESTCSMNYKSKSPATSQARA